MGEDIRMFVVCIHTDFHLTPLPLPPSPPPVAVTQFSYRVGNCKMVRMRAYKNIRECTVEHEDDGIYSNTQTAVLNIPYTAAAACKEEIVVPHALRRESISTRRPVGHHWKECKEHVIYWINTHNAAAVLAEWRICDCPYEKKIARSDRVKAPRIIEKKCPAILKWRKALVSHSLVYIYEYTLTIHNYEMNGVLVEDVWQYRSSRPPV